MDLSSRCVLSACCPSAVSCRIFSCPARRMWRDKRPLKTDTGSCVHTITGHKHMLLGSSTQGSTVCLRWITDRCSAVWSSRSPPGRLSLPLLNRCQMVPHTAAGTNVWTSDTEPGSLFLSFSLFLLCFYEREGEWAREKKPRITQYSLFHERKRHFIYRKNKHRIPHTYSMWMQ